ncbi:MAG: hypothetical protein LUF85_04195 [Bacteroides sp.]|nr:hypothetical protein [Bacteroides sp.]
MRRGLQNVIDEADSRYEITTSGVHKGRIIVKHNVEVLAPYTLYFYAEYVDPRTNQVLVFRDSHQIICINESPALPTLQLSVPETVLYSPWDDPARQTITATLMMDNDVLTGTTQRKFWWYKQLEGTIRLLDPELDPEVVSITDNTLIIDREFMGDEVGIVCKGEYATSHRQIPAAPSGSALVATTRICRRIPDFDYDYSGVPTQIAPDQTTIYPKLIITTNKGVVSNVMGVLRASWYVKKNTSGATWQQVSHGATPALSTSYIKDSTGLSMDLGVEIEDRGPFCILTDKDGDELTDQAGNVLWAN